jgi:acetyl-CoA carboxylase, biotin carboxylase subunit
VEHPVTEMVVGLDLVREQIRVAAGEALPFGQEDVRPEGAAIEFRVYAEDPDAGFLPQAGTIRRLELPAGPGVRCDFGARAGGTVPVHYDPMIGKIIVWAPSRAEALARSRRALDECALEGIHTTLPFHRWLLRQDAFVSGAYDTGYLAHSFRRADPPEGAAEDAAVLAAIFATMEVSAPRVLPAMPSPSTGPEPGEHDGEKRRPMTAGYAETPSRWRTALPGFRTGTSGERR